MREYVQRFVNLEKQDYWIVKRLAAEKGLGLKGFSAALRLIIREWHAERRAAQTSLIPHPLLSPKKGEQGSQSGG